MKYISNLLAAFVLVTFISCADATSADPAQTVSAEPDKTAGGSPLRAGKYEVWRGSIDPDMVSAILASRSLHVRETTLMPDDKADITNFDIDLTGLTSVWPQLAASCAAATPAPKSPWPAIQQPNASVAPPAAPSP